MARQQQWIGNSYRVNRMLPILSLCLVGALTAASVSSAAQSPATQPTPNATTQPPAPLSLAMLDRLQKSLKTVQTVESDFVQEKKLAILDHPLVIKGHFGLAKPDRLIWIVHEPVRYAVRIEGEEVRQWDEDTNHVDVIHLAGDPTFKAVSEQIQAWFLGNYDTLAKSYDVNVLNENPLSLEFIPKSDTMVAKVISRVKVTFSGDQRYIETMVIDEAGGDSNTIHFVGATVNQPIKDDVWRIPPNDK
jgi:outer membrane lipoprotein-sorting protein